MSEPIPMQEAIEKEQQRIDLDDIPTAIADAAYKIQEWFDLNGYKGWEFLGVADRKLVSALRREREQYKEWYSNTRACFDRANVEVDKLRRERDEARRVLDEVKGCLDNAGVATGEQLGRTHTLAERISILVVSKDYAWRQLDAARKAAAETNLGGSVSGTATAPRHSLTAEHIVPESPFESECLGGESSASPAQIFRHNPAHEIGTCGRCGEEMAYNVPRLGPNGGYIHKATGSLSCADEGPAQHVIYSQTSEPERAASPALEQAGPGEKV